MVTWGDYEKDFECDYTQRIHTMEALAELLKSDHCPDSRTLADEKLMEKVNSSTAIAPLVKWSTFAYESSDVWK